MALNSHVLDKLGLGNRHAEWGEYTDSSPKVRVAYCNSDSCLKRAHGMVEDKRGSMRLASHRNVRKNVGPQAWQCPDCFRMLFWELE